MNGPGFKFHFLHLVSSTENDAEPDSLPFVVVCPCSARPVPECSARAFWVVSQTPTHPGTSWPSPGCAMKRKMNTHLITDGDVRECLRHVMKYLYLSELCALLLVHLGHLGFSVRLVSDGVEVALIFVWARAPVVVVTVLCIPAEFNTVCWCWCINWQLLAQCLKKIDDLLFRFFWLLEHLPFWSRHSWLKKGGRSERMQTAEWWIRIENVWKEGLTSLQLQVSPWDSNSASSTASHFEGATLKVASLDGSTVK